MKRALIVGGSEGIGLAIAREMVRRGHGVTIASRDAAKLAAAAERFSGETRPATIVLDVKDRERVEEALLDWVRAEGLPDIVVLCPGFTVAGPFSEIGVSQHREMMDLNYFGYLHVLLTLVPLFNARRSGHLVMLSSALGLMGVFGFSGYCASKFAVLGLAEALASEMAAAGVKVSCVCPPAVDTPGFRRELATKSDAVREMELSTGLLDSDYTAKCIVRGIERGRFMILPGVRWTLAATASRLFPGLRRMLTRAGPDFWEFKHVGN